MDQNYYKEVSDSLKLVFDLTSRIDERTKTLVSNYDDAKEKIDKLAEHQSNVLLKVISLESKDSTNIVKEIKNEINVIEGRVEHLSDRLMTIEKDLQSHAGKWAVVLDFIFKIGVIVVGGLIMYKLGIKP
jgi:chromosome segregation ATPase